jgi:hypothetical protein
LPSPVHLKLSLAVYGIRLGKELAKEKIFSAPSTARDFASRDVELLLPEDIIARCPVGTHAAAKSPYELQSINDRFVIVSADGESTPVSVVPPPRFYEQSTSLGTPMWQVGTVHAGYLSIDPATSCGFASKGVACQFCTMQAEAPTPIPEPRSVDEVLEVVHAAFDEGAAEFIYFNTGYFDSDDGGFDFLRPYVEAVKKHFDTLVALQMHPPRDNRWIDHTYASGVDALSYAIEIHDPVALARFCKGRTELIGRERYYDALAYAAKIFPSGTVWSDLIVGLEPLESTTAGITAQTDMGVLPVLSLFRPLDETELRGHMPPDPESIAPVYAHLYQSVRDARINVQFMRDLGYAVTPIEARFFAGEDAKLDVAVSSFYRSKIGSRAVRGLSKLRRRLRVKRVSESFDSSRL